MFGLKSNTVQNIKQAIAKIPDIDKAILYGSRAKGNYRNGSDIDITLLGKNLTLNNSVYPLMDALEDLYLPYMFDISIFSNIDNENLIDHIHRAGKVFYQREKQLPDGWVVKKLGDVCEVIAGQSPEGKYYNSKKNGLPFYQGKKEFTKKYIGEPAKWTTKVAKIAEENDILMSVRAPVGPVNFSTQKICIGRGLAAIRADKFINREFLFNFLSKHENQIVGNTGAVFNSINKKQIENIEISLPPLPEQKRIVAILDQAFTAIGKVKSNTEQNLKNARELFQSQLQTEFATGKLKIKSGEWQEKRLGDVCLVERGSSPRPIAKYITDNEDGVNWIKIGDAKMVDKYIYKTNQKITVEGARKSRYVKVGDFILSNSMSYGKPYIMKTDGYIHDGWFVLRLHDFIHADYFFILLSSSYISEQFNKLASGSVVKNISGDLVKKVVLPIPPLKEQKCMVKELDALATETKKLEAIYNKKLYDLDELKKSILQQAFNGEL